MLYEVITNPLPDLAKQAGYFLKRGLYLPGLERQKKWNFTPTVKPGETVVVTATTTTDANGNYVFTDLLPGVYTVTEGAANGYLDVSDTDGSGNGRNNFV